MRERLYKEISARLGLIYDVDGVPVYFPANGPDTAPETAEKSIRHFDLWNENVAQLTQQRPFQTPAVFFEFSPIIWQAAGMKAKRARIDVRLHIISATLATMGTQYEDAVLYRFRLIQAMEDALCTLSGRPDERGRSFSTLVKLESDTDHNHEQVCEDIEVWATFCHDLSAYTRNGKVLTSSPVSLNTGDVFTFVFEDPFV